MPIYKGSGENPESIYVGVDSIGEVYVGQDLVWQKWIEFFSFQTNSPATETFDPEILGNDVLKWDLGDGTILIGNSITHTYADGSDKTVTVYRKRSTVFIVSMINVPADKIINELDLSPFTKLTSSCSIYVSTNPGITSIIFPTVTQGAIISYGGTYLNVTSLDLSGMPLASGAIINASYCSSLVTFTMPSIGSGSLGEINLWYCSSLEELDLSGISAWGSTGHIFINYCSSLASLILPASEVTGSLNSFQAVNCSSLAQDIDLTCFTSVLVLQLSVSNSPVTGILFAESVSGSIFQFLAFYCDLQGDLDLTCFSSIYTDGLTLYVNNNPDLTGVLFDSGISGKLSKFHADYCGLEDTLDLSMFVEFAAKAEIWASNNPLLQGVSLGETNSGSINSLYFYNCDLQSLDISMITLFDTTGYGSWISCSNNPDMGNPVLMSSYTGYMMSIQLENCGLSGTFDISVFEDWGSSAYNTIYLSSNSLLTGVTFPSTTATFNQVLIVSCSLGYCDFTVMPNMFKQNGSTVSLTSNGMSAAVVNHILYDLAGMVSGEGAGGDYTGRVIYIAGTNAAPDNSSGGYDGLQAKSDLQGKGFSVVTN